MIKKILTLSFDKIKMENTSLVGGKNASLGEMYSALSSLGIKVPNGFAVTADAYDYFIESNNLRTKIDEIIKNLNVKNVKELEEKGEKIRSLILSAKFPEDLKTTIEIDYLKLAEKDSQEVAVRSSATAEDLPGASFAGQQETYLNIKGKDELIKAIQKCFASLYTNRAISYRHDKGFDRQKIALSVGVQTMVRSDLGSSGVAFTLDPETGFRNVIVINGAFGLGEAVVQGRVIPDEWIVFKEGLEKGYSSIIEKKKGTKRKKIIYSDKGGIKDVNTTEKEQNSYSLSENEVLELSKWCLKIEKYFSKIYGKNQPMDIEWAKDGRTSKLYIIQARPETVHSEKKENYLEEYILSKKGKELIKGICIGTKIASGKVRIAKSVKDIRDFKKGEILVSETTDPDWEPIMKIAGGIVTDKGGRTSHAAIVARELGIACIVGTNNATHKIKSGSVVTVDCSSGAEGVIFEGHIPFQVKRTSLKKLPETKTSIMINIGSPDEAFENSHLPVKGVGLAREEFIIAGKIKIHPNALINFDKIKDVSVKKEIEKITKDYSDKKKFYVDNLASGIAKIAASFWPYQVIVRFSDFKSNEYRGLLGGSLYEPDEENPMIGWRGTSRYYDAQFIDAFVLEVKAIKKVREEMGLYNVVPMLPFVRTLNEVKKVMRVIEKGGLKRDISHIRNCSKEVQDCGHFRLYMMCEIPSNAILAEEFLELVDGYSIGSNDLAQLTLGLDRDSNIIAGIGDENDKAVRALIKQVIEKCRKMKKYVGICGQGPSDSLDFAEFLIRCGIDSVSLNPDSVIKTMIHIANIEKDI
jgi:pyruvate, water dikinase